MHALSSSSDSTATTVESPIRRIRRAAGLTIAELAAFVGCSSATISAIEAARVSDPREVLLKIAALGYDADALVREYRAFRDAMLAQQAARARERLARVARGAEVGDAAAR